MAIEHHSPVERPAEEPLSLDPPREASCASRLMPSSARIGLESCYEEHNRKCTVVASRLATLQLIALTRRDSQCARTGPASSDIVAALRTLVPAPCK